MSLKEFKKELRGSRAEGELLKTMFYSLAISLILLALLYYFKLRYVESFSKQLFFIFLALLSYALIIPAIRQVRAYEQFPCMSGMMIGMTFGMIAGFLPGFYIGATNGMFWGSVFGMSVGIFFGIWNGKCCGVMGFMEGIMAGFMGGLMGAMTSVMMINDNLKAASIIVFIIGAVIMSALNYMVYQETKERARELKEDHFLTILISFILTALTIWIIVFGPRSALFT
jgi:MFS family permease